MVITDVIITDGVIADGFVFANGHETSLKVYKVMLTGGAGDTNHHRWARIATV